MLIIREQQIQHFIAADEPALVRLIRQVVRETNPERVRDYSDQTLDSMANIGIQRAKSHGLELAEDITAFVALMFDLAPNFDKQKDIEKILNDKTYSPAENVRYLWERVPEKAWKEAEGLYDVKIWFPDKQ